MASRHPTGHIFSCGVLLASPGGLLNENVEDIPPRLAHARRTNNQLKQIAQHKEMCKYKKNTVLNEIFATR